MKSVTGQPPQGRFAFGVASAVHDGDRKAQAKGIRYRSGVHSHRIRIPEGLQPRVSQFVRAGMWAALKVFL
jgi:hypothetical protein